LKLPGSLRLRPHSKDRLHHIVLLREEYVAQWSCSTYVLA
jgi:hypothetical protein